MLALQVAGCSIGRAVGAWYGAVCCSWQCVEPTSCAACIDMH
jgi:hypothetical protein